MKQRKLSAKAAGRAEEPSSASIGWILAALWALFILCDSFSLSVFQFTFLEDFLRTVFSGAILRADLGWHLIEVCAMWFLFTRLGTLLAGRLHLNGMTRIEFFLISAGLGAGTASLSLLGLGLAGLWNPKLLSAIFCIGLAVCAGILLLNLLRLRKNRDLENPHPRPDNASLPQERPDFLQGIAIGLILLAVIVSILATAGPAIYYDSLVYHLALPKLYLLQGRIIPTPSNLYSGVPLGTEMLYGLSLALGNENLACLLYCSFGILTMLAIWALLRRCASSAAGVLGALLFYVSPVVLCSSWWCGSDLAGAFYLTLALLVIALKLQSSEGGSMANPIVAGALLGSAMAVKYTIAPMLGIFPLSYFWLRRRIDRGGALKETVFMSTVAVLVFAPWPIKNAFFYGNPLYPFLHNLMGRASPADWSGFLADAHSQNLARLLSSAAAWKDLLMRPWTFSMGTPSLTDFMGMSFLVFIPWALCQRWGILKRRDEVPPVLTAIGLIGLAAYVSWTMTSGLVRFIVPTLPIISCIAALAITRGPIPSWLRRSGWLVAIWAAMINLLMAFSTGLDIHTGLWSQLLSNATSSAYLGTRHTSYPSPYFPAMEYINQHLPPDAKVLFLGESRAYYCERNFVASTVFDDNPFWVAAREAKSSEDLFERMKKLGVTHIFVNASSLYTFGDRATVLPRDVVAGEAFGDFWNRYLENIYEDHQRTMEGATKDWLIVYKLRDKPVANPPAPSPNNPIRIVLASLLRRANT